jgi:uncharacterized membrane protein YjjP (DUF1212 family)
MRARVRSIRARAYDLVLRRPRAEMLPAPPPVVEEPPAEVLDLLRQVGVAMCRAGDATDRVTLILEDIATAYAAHGVSFFVFPTGVFVRIEAGTFTRVDFAPGGSAALRLDQVDALYRLIDDIRQVRTPVLEASERLDRLLTSVPRFGGLVTLVGHGVLTVGLGLILNPTSAALPVYVLLGLLVGMLRRAADRHEVVDAVFPVATSFLVTWVALDVVAPVLGAQPLDIVVASLVTLLPGAALTMAMVELSAGSMVSGASRLVFGLQRLLLLSFGIAMGVNLAGGTSYGQVSAPLGDWAPWLGVLVLGVGHYLASSAPRGSLRWLLVVLYITYAVQAGAGLLLGPLGASFLAGAVVLPVAYAVQQRRSGPPVPVTFLPAFWMLVPGALGLQGVAHLVGADEIAGLGEFLQALLSVVAIAAGVLVGAAISERAGRVTSTWRGL